MALGPFASRELPLTTAAGLNPRLPAQGDGVPKLTQTQRLVALLSWGQMSPQKYLYLTDNASMPFFFLIKRRQL